MAWRSYDVGKRPNDGPNPSNGPDWHDVREFLTHIEAVSNSRVQLCIRTQAIDRRRGRLVVELYMDTLRYPLAVVGVGSTDTYGARTVAGAAYQACLIWLQTMA